MAISVDYKSILGTRTSLGETALHVACYRKDFDRAKAIVNAVVSGIEPQEASAFIAETNNNGDSAIDIVAADTDPKSKQIFQLLRQTLVGLESKSIQHIPRSFCQLNIPTPVFHVDSPRSPADPFEQLPLLFRAVIKNDLRALAFQIRRQKTDVNQMFRDQTPLTIAVQSQNFGAVQALLRAPAIDPEKPDGHGRPPIVLAERLEDFRLIKLFRDFKKTPDKKVEKQEIARGS